MVLTLLASLVGFEAKPTPAAAAAVGFSADSPPLTATVGAVYTYTFVAQTVEVPGVPAGPAPTYALAQGAPSWLSIGAASGVISGVPPAGTTSFSYTVLATATVAYSSTTGEPVRMTGPAGPFTVTTAAASSTGAIAGTVAVASGSASLCAFAFPVTTSSTPVYASGQATANATTGAYVIADLAPGSYQVEFTACGVGSPGVGSTVVDQWYKSHSHQASPATIEVTAGRTTTGIDATLLRGGQVAGTVDAASGATTDPAQVCVFVFDSSGIIANGRAGANGSYETSGVPPGSYTVGFSYCGTATFFQYYDYSATQAGAATVVVASGTTTGIDATIPASETTGAVSFEESGLPVTSTACDTTPWAASVGGQTVTCSSPGSSEAALTLSGLGAGPQPFTVSAPPGATATPTCGTITVTPGSDAIQAVAFAPDPSLARSPDGDITVCASGLPAGVSPQFTLAQSAPGSPSPSTPRQLSTTPLTVAGLAPGEYTLTPGEACSSGSCWLPKASSKTVSVSSGTDTAVVLAYRSEEEGSLSVTVAGLPSGLGASISLVPTASNSVAFGFSGTVVGNRSVSLIAGSYALGALEACSTSGCYDPSSSTPSSVSVTAGATSTLTISYVPATAKHTLAIVKTALKKLSAAHTNFNCDAVGSSVGGSPSINCSRASSQFPGVSTSEADAILAEQLTSLALGAVPCVGLPEAALATTKAFSSSVEILSNNSPVTVNTASGTILALNEVKVASSITGVVDQADACAAISATEFGTLYVVPALGIGLLVATLLPSAYSFSFQPSTILISN